MSQEQSVICATVKLFIASYSCQSILLSQRLSALEGQDPLSCPYKHDSYHFSISADNQPFVSAVWRMTSPTAKHDRATAASN